MSYDPGRLQIDPKEFPDELSFLCAQAKAARRWVIAISGHAKTGHVGSALSTVDLLTALYFRTLHLDPSRPRWEERDRFILSKGHAASGVYTTLAARGFFPVKELWEYLSDGSAFTAHVNTKVPGVELSTGSLGHGLPVGVGLAFAAKRCGAPWRTFVMLSDGECNEGSTWEAVLAAGNLRLDNLTALVDYNKMQALGPTHVVMELEPFAMKWRSFRWATREIDGHDMGAICTALASVPFEIGKPNAVIAHTLMGKGVSFMEGMLEWHYLAPSSEQVALALQELI